VVHVLLADDATLKRLNRTFRGKNKATDVLSFPAGDNGSGVAGDLAISLETAARQADRGEMAAREAVLRRELRVATSLIARVTHGVATGKADSSASLRNDKQKSKRIDRQNSKRGRA